MNYKIIDINEINMGLVNAYCNFLDGYDYKTCLAEQFNDMEWREMLKYLDKLNIKTTKELLVYSAKLNGDIPAIQAGV